MESHFHCRTWRISITTSLATLGLQCALCMYCIHKLYYRYIYIYIYTYPWCLSGFSASVTLLLCLLQGYGWYHGLRVHAYQSDPAQQWRNTQAFTKLLAQWFIRMVAVCIWVIPPKMWILSTKGIYVEKKMMLRKKMKFPLWNEFLFEGTWYCFSCFLCGGVPTQPNLRRQACVSAAQRRLAKALPGLRSVGSWKAQGWKEVVFPSSKNRGILPPKWMVKIMVPNPMNKWMIWGCHYFWKHPYRGWHFLPSYVGIIS